MKFTNLIYNISPPQKKHPHKQNVEEVAVQYISHKIHRYQYLQSHPRRQHIATTLHCMHMWMIKKSLTIMQRIKIATLHSNQVH
jgi:hypothetical protein